MLITFHALSTLSLWLKEVLLPYGGPGLMVLAICDSSFISLSGINDVLLITFAVARPGDMFELAGLTALGSVVGCAMLYALGRKGGEAFLKKRFADNRVLRIQAWYQKFGVLAVIVPAVLPPPAPLKLFVVSAGAFGINWPTFLTGIALGRSIRYFALGFLAITYGPAALDFVRMNFGKIGVATAAVIIAVALVVVFTRRGRSGGSIVV
jgi:membrane protein YqaA with SNARE-associated domain